MRHPLLVVLALPLALTACEEEREIRVLTDRTASHLNPLLEAFAHKAKVKVTPNFVGDGLLARLAARPNEADVIITKNAAVLEVARQRGLLAPFDSSLIESQVPADLRHPSGSYTLLSYRARAIFYAKGRVNSSELSNYLDLAHPKWKGRICVRSGLHTYNTALFAQLAATHGLARTRTFLEGLRANLAREPEGNDRAQVRAIYEGKCDLALANSYYMGIMLGRDDQRAWAESTRVFFPDQTGDGAFVLASGAALTEVGRQKVAATKLLEYLTGNEGQAYLSGSLFAYPVNNRVGMSPVNRKLGASQGVPSGLFKRRPISLAEIVEHQDEVVELLAQIRFDEKD